MHLTCRTAGDDDIAVCHALLPPGFVCEPELRACLPTIWQAWRREGYVQMVVLEDAERPAGGRVVGFGTSAFVTDAFLCELRLGALPPSPAAHAARRHLAGASPLLGPDAVRLANSGDGLNLLALHLGWDEAALTADEARWVRAKMLEAFGSEHAGYQLKAVLQEVYTEGEMRRGLAAGAQLWTDYADFYGSGFPPPDTDRERPYLIGNTRAEVPEGSTLSAMFYYSPPRFFFKPWEQALLRHALRGHGDSEAAGLLHVAASTVQKRWNAIYGRVADAAPDLLPADAVTGRAQATRGAEKRRHLLTYLRHHPEELRPTLPPKAG